MYFRDTYKQSDVSTQMNAKNAAQHSAARLDKNERLRYWSLLELWKHTSPVLSTRMMNDDEQQSPTGQ